MDEDLQKMLQLSKIKVYSTVAHHCEKYQAQLKINSVNK